MSDLKVGDEIYTKRYASWGTHPMIVIKISDNYPSTYVEVMHPILGIAILNGKDLIKSDEISEERKQKLAYYRILIRLGIQNEDLRNELFPY